MPCKYASIFTNNKSRKNNNPCTNKSFCANTQHRTNVKYCTDTIHCSYIYIITNKFKKIDFFNTMTIC